MVVMFQDITWLRMLGESVLYDVVQSFNSVG